MWSICFVDSEPRFLAFVTGTERAPLGGLKDVKLLVHKNGVEPTNRLPTAQTCFNLLWPGIPSTHAPSCGKGVYRLERLLGMCPTIFESRLLPRYDSARKMEQLRLDASSSCFVA